MFKNSKISSKKISKKSSIIILLAVLIGLVTAIYVPSIAYSESSSKQLEMSVKVGYDDMIRVGSTCPFSISLINKGGELSGEAQVIADTGYMSKVIYAIPFILPKGSNKELTMDVPINTANRKIEIRVVKGSKVLKTFKYEYKKLIAPETPVIGILSDDKSGLNILNGIKVSENITQNNIHMSQKYAISSVGGKDALLPDRPAEVIRLNNTNFPVNNDALNSFDVIVISDYDTSSLNDSQKMALENWVKQGNNLIIGTGPNSNKVYKGLNENFKFFQIEGQKSISISKELKEYTEKEASMDEAVVSTGKIGDGKVLIGSKSNPLALEYKIGDGEVIILAFDPTLSPISSWKHADEMWRKLLIINNLNNVSFLSNQSPVYRGGINEGVVYQVPDGNTPAIPLLLIVIIIYIIIVGPIVYIFLKIRDKRDLNWVIVPVIAIVFIGIIYFAGFKTRYNTAILNSYSIIDIDSSSKVAHIKTSMSAFNNKKGKMRFEYKKDFGVEVSPTNDNYYNPQYNPDDYKNAIIVGKKVLGDDVVYEHYKAGIWEPVLVNANKTEKYEGVVIDKVKIENNSLTATIKNNTNITFEESFVSVGNNFINIGDVAPGKEQNINVSLGDLSKVKKSFSEFLNNRYPYQPYSSGKRPKDWKDQIRKRGAFEGLMNTENVVNTSTNTKITFYALNYNDLDYGIKLNGKKPKKYNINIIYCSEDIMFEKGVRVNIPQNMVNAIYESGEVGFDGQFGENMRVDKNTEVVFKFELPKSFDPEQFTINWPKDDFSLNMKDMNAPPLEAKDYKTFVYNNTKKKWEEVPEKFNANGNLSQYINNSNEIKVKAAITLDNSAGQGYYISKPEIQLIGVVK